MSPTANLWVQNIIFNDKSAILLRPGTRWNKNFASQRQNYAQKMQDAQVTKSLAFAHSSQSISCSHMKRKGFFLNPIIQFNSLSKLYLLILYVIYDYFF